MAVGDDKTTGLNDGDLLEASNAKPTSFSVGPGGSRAEIGPNFWSGKFRAVHQMTDVTWGPEGFSDKVFTSCSTGEVMVWDFGKGGLKWGMSKLHQWSGMYSNHVISRYVINRKCSIR